jgi:signal transduction histidine kinase
MFQTVQNEATRWAWRVRFALGGVTLMLLALTAGGALFVRRAAQFQERALENSLVTLGGKVASSLPAEDVLWVLPLLYDSETGEVFADRIAEYQDIPAWGSLKRATSELDEVDSIASVWLLAPSGELLLKGDGSAIQDGERRAAIEANPDFVARAAAGEVVASARQPTEPLKRVFIPLRRPATEDEPAKVIGILRIEANREYFDAVRNARTRSLVALAVAFLLIAAAWYSFIRLVRRAAEAERHAALSDRLRALGTLTAGIAHEIRNPLGILTLEIEELRAIVRAMEETPARKDLAAIETNLKSEVARLSNLTEQFLDYARPARTETGKTNLAESLPMMLRLFSKGIAAEKRTFEESIATGDLTVALDEPRLRQVVLNLLRNADEALGDRKGTIRVALVAEGETALLTVVDDGPGMAPEVAAQVFDPFFTTRAEGTGLGLSLCRNIVETAGGTISLESTPGSGSRFSVRLPLMKR